MFTQSLSAFRQQRITPDLSQHDGKHGKCRGVKAV